MLVDKIILHHSATDDGPGNSTAAIRKYHIEHNGWLTIGYHFVCELVGDTYEILVGRPENMNGAHCPGQNDRALGVCLVGNFMLTAPPEAQLRCAAKHVASLCERYNIPVENVTRHSLWNDTDCPGDYFDLEQFKDMVLDY